MARMKCSNQLDTVDEWLDYLFLIKARYGGQTQVLTMPDGKFNGVVEPGCYQLIVALNGDDEAEVVEPHRAGATCMYGGDPEDPAHIGRVKSNLSKDAAVALLIL